MASNDEINKTIITELFVDNRAKVIDPDIAEIVPTSNGSPDIALLKYLCR